MPTGVVKGPFEGDSIPADGLQGFRREPFPGLGEGLFPGQDLLPVDGFPPPVGLPNGGLQHGPGGLPDVRAGAVTLNKRNSDGR